MSTSGQSGSQLPCLHQEGEVPRNNLATHTNWLVASEGEEWAIHRDGLTLDLVGPPCVITEALDAQRQVCSICSTEWFSIVKRFQTLNTEKKKDKA